MAGEPETPEIDDELQLTKEDQLLPDDDQVKDPDDEGDDEEIVTFGDDLTNAQPDDSPLIRQLRQVAKDANKRAAEAERRSSPAVTAAEVGEKPTLWDDEISGDEDKYDAAMDAWKARKASAEKQVTEQTQSSEEQKRDFNRRLEKVIEVKASLGSDADAAFENVKAVLGEERAAAIVHITDTPEAAARLMFALGKYPDRLAELAAETDPLRFVKQVAKLEGQVKTVKRRRVIEPDTPERGSGKMSRETSDKTRAKLEAEAEKSRSRTKIIAYNRKLREAAKG